MIAWIKDSKGIGSLILILMVIIGGIGATLFFVNNTKLFQSKTTISADAQQNTVDPSFIENLNSQSLIKDNSSVITTPIPSPLPSNTPTPNTFSPGFAFTYAKLNKEKATPIPSASSTTNKTTVMSTSAIIQTSVPSPTPFKTTFKAKANTTTVTNQITTNDNDVASNKGRIYIVTAPSVNKGCINTASIYIAVNNINSFGTDVIINYNPANIKITALKPADIPIGSTEFDSQAYTAKYGKIMFSLLQIYSNQSAFITQIAKIEYYVLPETNAKSETFSIDYDPNNLSNTLDTNIVDFNDKTYADHFDGGEQAKFAISSGSCS